MTAFWYVITALGLVAAIINFVLAGVRRQQVMASLVRALAGLDQSRARHRYRRRQSHARASTFFAVGADRLHRDGRLRVRGALPSIILR